MLSRRYKTNYHITQLLKKLRIMETKKLTVFGVYLGRTLANPNRIFICVKVMYFCDTDAPAREICPEKPYRLNALLIEENEAKREELIKTLSLLSRGGYVELHIDVEGGTVVSADDVIIKRAPEEVKVSRLAEELDDKF